MENTLKEVDPSIKFNHNIETMIMGISKLFLIELFEESVEIKEKMEAKNEIDDEVLEEAYRRIQSRYPGN